MSEECKVCKAAFKQFSVQLLEDCKSIVDVCLEQSSKNPIHVMDTLMDLPWCGFHSPEHHIMVGSALLTAFKNAGGNIDEVTGRRMTIAAFPFRCEMADGGFVRLVAWEEGSF